MLFICCSLCVYFGYALRDKAAQNQSLVQDIGYGPGTRHLVLQSSGSITALGELASSSQNRSKHPEASKRSPAVQSEITMPNPFQERFEEKFESLEYKDPEFYVDILKGLQVSLGWVHPQSDSMQVTFEVGELGDENLQLLQGLIDDLSLGLDIETKAAEAGWKKSANLKPEEHLNEITIKTIEQDSNRYQISNFRASSSLKDILVGSDRTFCHKDGDRVLVLTPQKIVKRYAELKSDGVEFHDVELAQLAQDLEQDGVMLQNFVDAMMHVSILAGVDKLAPEEVAWGFIDDPRSKKEVDLIEPLLKFLLRLMPPSVSPPDGGTPLDQLRQAIEAIDHTIAGSATQTAPSGVDATLSHVLLELSARMDGAEQQPAPFYANMFTRTRSVVAPDPLAWDNVRNTGLGFVLSGVFIGSVEQGMGNVALIARAGQAHQRGTAASVAPNLVEVLRSRPSLFRLGVTTGTEGTFAIYQGVFASIFGGSGTLSHIGAGNGLAMSRDAVNALHPGADSVEAFARARVRGESYTRGILTGPGARHVWFLGMAFDTTKRFMRDHLGEDLSNFDTGACAGAAGRMAAFGAAPLDVLTGPIRQGQAPSSQTVMDAYRVLVRGGGDPMSVHVHGFFRSAAIVSLALTISDALPRS